jgi:phytoene dehydrogenase-like protein
LTPKLPAVKFLTQKGAFRRYGFGPRGTIGVLDELAEVVRRRGGDVWLNSALERIVVAGGRAEAVVVRRDGDEQMEVACDTVISNAGPAATVRLVGAENLPPDYVSEVRGLDVPTPLIVIDIASRHPLMEEAGIMFFATTDRLAAIGHLTSTCPEVAPDGWRLYVAYAAPVPALSPFDEAAEVQATMRELREQLTEFDRAKVLRTRVIGGDWPAMRTVAGRELPQATPIANVHNVGDGVRGYGDGGMQSCAVTAITVSDQVLASARR